MAIDYKKEIKKARGIYFSFPKTVFCKSLNEDILFTRIGWEHLVNKKDRTLKQSYYRVRNLHLVTKIFEKMPYYQSYKIKQKGCNEHKFWGTQAVVDGDCIELVIRQTGNQQKHFYSLVYKGRTPKWI